MTKRKTNTQFIENMMEFSKHGAMMQLFVMEGLRIYAERILAEQDEIKESMKNGHISPEAWIGCAKEFTEKLEEHFNGGTK